MAQTKTNDHLLDNPSIDPEKDRLGYATFAQHLADSICKMTVTEGFVIAVHGSWGAGKSTLLNFVVHYLQQKPDEEQPIIVPFNPWLFTGNQDITRRFFDQLQSVLTSQTNVPRGLRERIANFGRVISEIPLPYAQAGKAVATIFNDQEKEASELKEDVQNTVVQQQRRIVVVIDDIDRLPSEDIKQLFRIFKAIPNFTNVVYVLVFDKEVVSKALSETKEASVKTYFEKVIQLSFELPPTDKTSLRRLLFEKLEGIFADTPKELFEPTYWNCVYFQGIDHFITNLRDIVRLTDALTATYPVVKGEVNPVDFIAIESLRAFCPTVYDIIVKNKNAFVGKVNSLDQFKHFHNSWLAQLQDEDKEPVKRLLIQLFPKLEFVWGNSLEENEKDLESCNQLRISCPETFRIYFRLTLLEANLSSNQIKNILAVACNAKAFGEKLIELANQIRHDGTTQLREFLEKVEDDLAKDIPTRCIPSIVEAFFEVGEDLLRPEDEPNNRFDVGNEIRIHRLIVELLSRLDESERFELLKTSMTKGKALSIITRELENLNKQQGDDNYKFQDEGLLNSQHLKELEEIVAQRKQAQNAESCEEASPTDSDRAQSRAV
ncbi:KAP family NTPase [Mastigocladopsis repens]|uniref:KAP family NTPase n=1 Tax=Mastigocladopsis repens TaxID=221287 RepID=UPI00031379F4|nr:P-loop NTPase fold protein [Mastigocladopsis repens]